MTDDVMRRGALFIREAAIDWDVVPRDSYLRDIPALKGFDRLAFDSNVTFFADNAICWTLHIRDSLYIA